MSSHYTIKVRAIRAEPGKCEWSDDSISQEKTGRGVDDISTLGRIANETLS